MLLPMFCSLFSYMLYSELDWLIIYFTIPSWYGTPVMITARILCKAVLREDDI
jgi:hypothetical protein